MSAINFSIINKLMCVAMMPSVSTCAVKFTDWVTAFRWFQGFCFVIDFAVRRAKLGFVCGVKVPILEALARRQVLSVASATATAWAKRTQGGDGPQCESVKG